MAIQTEIKYLVRIKTLQNNIMILMKESRVQFQTRQDQYFKKIRAFLLYS